MARQAGEIASSLFPMQSAVDAIARASWPGDAFAALRLPSLPIYDHLDTLANTIETFSTPALDEETFRCWLAAEAADNNLATEVKRFTTAVLGLPEELWPQVAAVLIERRWRHAHTPIGYLRRAAQRMARTQELRAGLPTAHFIFTDSFDELVPALPEPDPAEEAEALASLKANFTDEQWLFLEKRMAGYGRVKMVKELGWTTRDVERLRKQVQRIRNDLLAKMKIH